MTNREYVLETMRRYGKAAAEDLQTRSADMDGTALCAEEEFIPDFAEAAKRENMLTRKAGQNDGFVCRSSAGRVVRLIQNYDSTVFTAEPEELPAQWRFVWSHDPAKALPFIALSTSPYNTDDCCTHSGKTWRCKMENCIWSPSDYPGAWEEVSNG